MNPQYPLYIVSKGRADSRLTSKALEKMNTPYNIVIEEHEYSDYSAVIDKKKIIVLDKKYQDEYETLDDLGDSKSKGAGAARNFAWEHSMSNGYSWHWIMDDNIDGFFRLNKNLKVPVGDGTVFRCMEDFCGRYTNVVMGGPNYFMFASRKSKMKPLVLNTRVYSCNLIRNDIPYRWRGRHNEDTDLSLQILKGGFCTILFNAFLQFKSTTQTVKGGNTTDFYEKDGRLLSTKMLVNNHPDVARIAWRFGRWHHHVNYKPFQRNKLIRREDYDIQKGVNNFGMELKIDPNFKG